MREFTKKEAKKLKKYWLSLEKLQDDFDSSIRLLEGLMQKDLKIDDLEFFLSEYGYYCGIGNISRTIKLIHEEKLKGKKWSLQYEYPLKNYAILI